MLTSDDLCSQLKAQGRRLTPQRRAIIRILAEERCHPSADQLFARVCQEMPDISPATVYNTLRELTEGGLAQELDLGLGERRYDTITEPHAHLVCTVCGRVEDVPYDQESLKLSPQHTHGFRVTDKQVTFRGYCPACATGGGH